MRVSKATASYTRWTARAVTDVTSRRRYTHARYFAIFLLVLVAVGNGVLRELVTFSLGNATASHVILVPFVTIALILSERDRIFSSTRPAVRVGVVVIGAGAALLLWGGLFSTDLLTDDRLSLSVAGLVVASVGGFLLFFGTQAFRAALFPLLFLVLSAPIPTGVIDGMTFALKRGSAEAVAGLFFLTGTPYMREGFVFSLPHFAIEIADECSGIRSSIALLLTMLLATHTLLRAGWAKGLVIVAVLPIAVLKNGIRVVTLTLLAVHVDPEYLTGQLHHDGGIVFFFLALGMLAPVMIGLRRLELRSASEQVL
jgi:exosortase